MALDLKQSTSLYLFNERLLTLFHLKNIDSQYNQKYAALMVKVIKYIKINNISNELFFSIGNVSFTNDFKEHSSWDYKQLFEGKDIDDFKEGELNKMLLEKYLNLLNQREEVLQKINERKGINPQEIDDEKKDQNISSQIQKKELSLANHIQTIKLGLKEQNDSTVSISYILHQLIRKYDKDSFNDYFDKTMKLISLQHTRNSILLNNFNSLKTKVSKKQHENRTLKESIE